MAKWATQKSQRRKQQQQPNHRQDKVMANQQNILNFGEPKF